MRLPVLPLAVAVALLPGLVPAQALDVSVSAYGSPSGVPTAAANTAVFSAVGTPSQQIEFDLHVPGGAGKTAALFVGVAQASVPIPPGQLLVDPIVWYAQSLDASGATRFSMPLPNALGGTLFAQAIAIDIANPGGLFVFSRGLQLAIVNATPTSRAFDVDTALTLLDLAWHAYEYPVEPNGRLGQIQTGRVLPGGFQVIEEIRSPAPPGAWYQTIGWPETYCFLAQNPAGDVAVVFRGTDFTSVRDWTTDILFPQTSGYHGGVLVAYQTVHARISSLLSRFVNSNAKVYFTGHSLGGGLAPIAALHLEPQLTSMGVARNDLVLYEFAGPRVLSPARASQLGGVVPNHFAVLNKDDIVTHVPVSIPGGDQFEHIPRVRALYPRRAMVAETGASYTVAVLPPLTPLPLAHFQDVYDDRLRTILPPPNVWLSVSSTGYMVIHWSFPQRAQWGFARDFIALYRGAPDPANPGRHLLNQWQWASSSGSYVTNTPKARDMHVAYVQQPSIGGEQKILGRAGPYTWNTPRVWLTTSNGWAQLNWSTPDPGAYDYVALYDRDPRVAGPRGYLVGQWQWATRGRSWVTWRRGTRGYWIAYIEDDNFLGSGRVVAVAGPY